MVLSSLSGLNLVLIGVYCYEGGELMFAEWLPLLGWDDCLEVASCCSSLLCVDKVYIKTLTSKWSSFTADIFGSVSSWYDLWTNYRCSSRVKRSFRVSTLPRSFADSRSSRVTICSLGLWNVKRMASGVTPWTSLPLGWIWRRSGLKHRLLPCTSFVSGMSGRWS